MDDDMERSVTNNHHPYFLGRQCNNSDSISSQFGWNSQPDFINPYDDDDDDFNGRGTAATELQATTSEKRQQSVSTSTATNRSSVSTSSSSEDYLLLKKSNCASGSGEAQQPPTCLEIPPSSSKSKKKGHMRIRQPRFAFVTKSEVDHLEDGYRWRKYGQKAVKNSPYPRSYFRCTNTKCTVKKRVERSWEDPTTVITTYEGQHCHQTAGFSRGGALSIREAAFGGQMGPPNSQFYHPGMQFPQPSPHSSINASLRPLLSVVPIEQREANIINRVQFEQTVPTNSPPQLPSDEGLLGDIVSPRVRNQHP